MTDQQSEMVEGAVQAFVRKMGPFVDSMNTPFGSGKGEFKSLNEILAIPLSAAIEAARPFIEREMLVGLVKLARAQHRISDVLHPVEFAVDAFAREHNINLSPHPQGE